MPRGPLIRSADFPYHITNRSNNREYFYIALPTLWAIFIGCFEKIKDRYGAQVHAFVLMSNHYHLILSTPDENLDEIMLYLHREIARKANGRAQRINHFFGGRYKWSLIDDEIYYWNAVKYVFQNPVRAGICSSTYGYQFSSLNRPEDDQWELTNPFDPQRPIVELDSCWLDDRFAVEQESLIRKTMRRKKFKAPKSSSKKLQKLETSPHLYRSHDDAPQS